MLYRCFAHLIAFIANTKMAASKLEILLLFFSMLKTALLIQTHTHTASERAVDKREREIYHHSALSRARHNVTILSTRE